MVLMASLNLSAGASGYLLGRVKRYQVLPLICLAIAIGAVLTLAWQGAGVSALGFEILIALIGVGFGPLAPLSTVVLQNSVAIHQFGTAVGTMTFSRNLSATMLVAIFGAIVLGTGQPEVGTLAGAPQLGSPEGFTRIFLVASLCLSVSLFALLILKEKPLHTEIGADAA